MADKSKAFPENAAGAYYVDDGCTACELCVSEAPDNFKINDDGSYAYVYKQPENDAEKEASESARESCPAEAIGNDG